MFSCEYCEIFKNTYFEEHLRKAATGFTILQIKRYCVNHAFMYKSNAFIDFIVNSF